MNLVVSLAITSTRSRLAALLATCCRPQQQRMSSRVVDMRSDTVTKPTPEMRRAMAEAEVGDDVFGEDPTVNLLQEKAAKVLGKEAALYVPSGTMGNLISVMCHCAHRGDEVIIGDRSHIAMWEQGGVAQLGGVFPRLLKNKPDGTLDIDEIRSTIMTDTHDNHCTLTRLVCIENTHNFTGGQPITPAYMDELVSVTHQYGIKIHVDGARLFNAATALGVSAAELVKHADSVSICLSKGLAAPVGSLVVGSKSFIAEAHKVRKSLGGGMRQVGILAAAGIIALEKMSLRLQEDHDNAKRLANGLAAMKELGIQIDPAMVKSNLVVFQLIRSDITPDEFCSRLEVPAGDGGGVVRILPVTGQLIRAVINYHITVEDVDIALAKITDVLKT